VSLIPERLKTLADRINTGLDSPETSRALVVFNLTNVPLSGVAVFDASMAWPTALPFPPVVVTEMGTVIVSSTITRYDDAADKKGRSDYRLIHFELRFAVQAVPSNGWKTYLAAYTQTSPHPLLDLTEQKGLMVAETMRHGGDLPPVGTFASAGLQNLA